MTEEQLQVARDNVDAFAAKVGFKPDLRFIHGYIEHLEGAP